MELDLDLDLEPRKLWREHGAYLAASLAAVLLVSWVTQGSRGAVAVPLYVLGALVAYRVITHTELVPEPRREQAIFAVVLGGSVGVLGALNDWNATVLTFIGVNALIYGLFALGLNLEFGFTGIINFGHVAFMGLGAYTTTLLSKRLLPNVDRLATPGLLSFALLAATALLVFLVVATLASVAAEVWWARREAESLADRTRSTLVAGGVAGGVAVLLLLVTVSYPLSGLWAQALVVLGSTGVGMLVAALLGVLIGIPTLRLREDYLAIATIGAAEILRQVALNEQWLTGGAQGVFGFPLPLQAAPQEWTWLVNLAELVGLRQPYKFLLLLMVLLALGLVYAVSEILVRAPYGRVLKAIREDEEVAEALGKNVFLYKLQALAIGSAVAALAGALYAWQFAFISPETFVPLVTFHAWIIIVLGGIGNNRGTILGAFLFWTFFEATRALELTTRLGLESTASGALRQLLIGLLLILFMMFKPEGILGDREEMVLGD